MTRRQSSDWDTTEWNSMRESLHTSSHRSIPSSNSLKLVITSPSASDSCSVEDSSLMAYTYEEAPRHSNSCRPRTEKSLLDRFGWGKLSTVIVVVLVLLGRFGTTEKWREKKAQAFIFTTSSLREAAGVEGQAPPPMLVIPHSSRFIFVGRIGEQETKAQVHLYSLGLLALVLNRTLVLPTVQRSLFGGCYSHPFELYYEKSSLEVMGIPTISQADFIRWSEGHTVAPSAQVISMRHTTQGKQRQIQIDYVDQEDVQRAMCVDRANLSFEVYEPLLVHPPDGRKVTDNSRMDFVKGIKERLKGGLGQRSSSQEPSSADVLVFDYDLRYPLLTPPIVALLSNRPAPLPYTYFPYSSIWTSLGTQIASNLSPLIAIHWRIETIPAQNLFPCGNALVSQLTRLKERFPEVSNVYFASDYPIEQLEQQTTSPVSAHSGTLTYHLSEDHHEAMRSFLREFKDKAEGLKLTSFLKEESTLALPENIKRGERIEDIDPALIGLLDKIVLMNAEVFLAGEPGVTNCAKNSSYTAHRERILQGGTS